MMMYSTLGVSLPKRVFKELESVVLEKIGFLMMDVERKKKGFTLVELLTVLAIITMLIGLLLPSLSMVRKFAKETKQKAQLATIGAALTTFRNDYGDYPRSNCPYPPPAAGSDYSGAQKLAEALLGWDLMGFHPQSIWDGAGTAYNPPDDDNLSARRGRYLELMTANAFKLGSLFANPARLAANTFVLCDVFRVKRVTLPPLPDGTITTVKAGTPILYYKANTRYRIITQIYNNFDNQVLVDLGRVTDDRAHPLGHSGGNYQNFYQYIKDPRVTATTWPYRPDSYILITAGADGLYGTSDDVCNFGN